MHTFEDLLIQRLCIVLTPQGFKFTSGAHSFDKD